VLGETAAASRQLGEAQAAEKAEATQAAIDSDRKAAPALKIASRSLWTERLTLIWVIVTAIIAGMTLAGDG
jgi:hypothetical protein